MPRAERDGLKLLVSSLHSPGEEAKSTPLAPSPAPSQRHVSHDAAASSMMGQMRNTPEAALKTAGACLCKSPAWGFFLREGDVGVLPYSGCLIWDLIVG